jgi:Transcription elongation factor
MSNGEAITPEGLEALKAELERLEGDARRDIAQRIKVARELGDLSENAEYPHRQGGPGAPWRRRSRA